MRAMAFRVGVGIWPMLSDAGESVQVLAKAHPKADGLIWLPFTVQECPDAPGAVGNSGGLDSLGALLSPK